MKGTKDDTAHEDVSTVLSIFENVVCRNEHNIHLYATSNCLLYTPQKITSFLVAIFGSNYIWIYWYMVYWYGLRMIIFIIVDFDNKRASHAERSLQQTEHRP